MPKCGTSVKGSISVVRGVKRCAQRQIICECRKQRKGSGAQEMKLHDVRRTQQEHAGPPARKIDTLGGF
jgi:hypothetical protein